MNDNPKEIDREELERQLEIAKAKDHEERSLAFKEAYEKLCNNYRVCLQPRVILETGRFSCFNNIVPYDPKVE